MLNQSRIIILIGLLLVVSVFSYSVWKKEQILTQGEDILIHLAPVDPRSLMQGDYMILNYDIPRIIEVAADGQLEGMLVYTLDEHNVVTFKRVAQPNDSLSANEKRLHFRNRRRGIQVGANSFFFQEGKAKTFEAAKYGELRVDGNGHSVLVALRDGDLKQLGLTSGLQ